MAAPSVAVTTLATPTGFAGVLQATGSIPIGESRWYRLVAIDATLVNNARRHSPACAEIGPFVADATNRRVALSWNAVAGAAAYRVYVRRSAVPNATYKETIANSPGTATFTFSQGAGLTFTDSAASFTAKRAFWEAGIVRAVLTGGDAGDPGTWHHVYDAILAASAAHVRKIIPDEWSRAIVSPLYSLAAYVEIGDGVTPTYFIQEDATVFCLGGLRVGFLAGGSTFRSGIYDAATGRRSRGSSVYVGGYGAGSRASAGVGRLVVQAETNDWNDSYLEDLGYKAVDVAAIGTGQNAYAPLADVGEALGLIGSSVINLRGSELAGLALGSTFASQHQLGEVAQLFERTTDGVSASGTDVTYSQVVVEDAVYGVQAAVASGYIRLDRLEVRKVTDADFHLILGSGGNAAKLLLRDAIFGDRADDLDPVVRFHASTSTGGIIAFEAGFDDAETELPDGSPAVGALVEARGADGSVLASAVTGGDGRTGPLYWEFLRFTCGVGGAATPAALSTHVTNGKLTRVDRRPVTIRVTAAGYTIYQELFEALGTIAEVRARLHVDAACNIPGVVGRIEIAGVVDREDVGGGVATLEEF